MLKINCDIGERGIAHPIDDQLMAYIDIANIACGGHAGDLDSVNYYRELALHHGVSMSAHLSYPDRLNFGRQRMEISHADLLDSLSEQYALLPVAKVKFHGALYHAANMDAELARVLLGWLLKKQVLSLIAPESSYLSKYCFAAGLRVEFEGFIERGYQIKYGNLELIPRGQIGAELTTLEAALAQYQLLKRQVLIIAGKEIPLNLTTACIHSDSSIALELASKIHVSK